MSISLASFIHKPHPLHFWMAGWLQKLPLSTVRTEYSVMNMKYLGKIQPSSKVRASNSASPCPLPISPVFASMDRSPNPVRWDVEGKVVNDLLRLTTTHQSLPERKVYNRTDLHMIRRDSMSRVQDSAGKLMMKCRKKKKLGLPPPCHTFPLSFTFCHTGVTLPIADQ